MYIHIYIHIYMGFSGGSVVKNLPAIQWVCSLGGKDGLEKEMQPTPVFLPGKVHEQRNLVGYRPQGHKDLDTA